MPRVKQTIPPVKKTLNIDQELALNVDLLLYSEVEGRVPFGAWKRYLERLIREDLKKRQKSEARENEAQQEQTT